MKKALKILKKIVTYIVIIYFALFGIVLLSEVINKIIFPSKKSKIIFKTKKTILLNKPKTIFFFNKKPLLV